MKRIATFLIMSIVVTVVWYGGRHPMIATFAQGIEQPSAAKLPRSGDEPVLPNFMRKKLDASNNILEGLVTDDLDYVKQGSDRLMQMSKAEEWRVSTDPTYARFSREFEQTVKRLKEKANKGSVDGAALAWMDVTLSCIECHEWVRNMVVAENLD